MKALKNISKKDHSIIEEMYNNKQSKYLASEIPNGICSSTKESSRGKGLKEIYERANNSTTCKKFVIISNKAMVNILNTKKTYYDSDHSFNGTAFYWEMQK